MIQFNLAFIEQSPVPEIRKCYNSSQNSIIIQRDLFNIAFASCWEMLSEENQEKIKNCILNVLIKCSNPEILKLILLLEEEMERREFVIYEMKLELKY